LAWGSSTEAVKCVHSADFLFNKVLLPKKCINKLLKKNNFKYEDGTTLMAEREEEIRASWCEKRVKKLA